MKADLSLHFNNFFIFAINVPITGYELTYVNALIVEGATAKGPLYKALKL